MQTFLPVDDFLLSAKILDKKRAWKQTVEANSILNILEGKVTGYSRHPCIRMWKNYEAALTCYYNVFWTWCVEHHKIKVNKLQLRKNLSGTTKYPDWFGYPEFHASHRSNLLRKDSIFYGRYGWTEQNNLSYMWPVNPDSCLLNTIYIWKQDQLQNQLIINHQGKDG